MKIPMGLMVDSKLPHIKTSQCHGNWEIRLHLETKIGRDLSKSNKHSIWDVNGCEWQDIIVVPDRQSQSPKWCHDLRPHDPWNPPRQEATGWATRAVMQMSFPHFEGNAVRIGQGSNSHHKSSIFWFVRYFTWLKSSIAQIHNIAWLPSCVSTLQPLAPWNCGC